MPTSSLPFCPAPGCPNRSRGLCSEHRSAKHRATNAARGKTDEQGYTRRWKKFVIAFRQMLLSRHILPICGARLAPGPSPDSQCAAQGRLTLEGLHTDHAVPLEPWERSRPERVLDAARVQLLCVQCHSTKTRKEMRQNRPGGDDR